ncbi:F-box associated region [uncultured archaeon]|nr:F-box associated region [uncultured archaeon]
MNTFSFRAQGTAEYLVIIGVIVVISLAVIGLLNSQSTSIESVSGNSSQVKQKIGVYGVSIVDAIGGLDENGLLVLSNTSGENFTVTNINVDGVDHEYSNLVFSGESKPFKLQSILACEGASRNYSIKIYYTSSTGLEKVADFDKISIDCALAVTGNTVFVEEGLDFTPPSINLYSPADNNSISSADSNVEFIFSSDQDTNACYLYVQDEGVWNIADQNLSTVLADSNYYMDANIAYFGEGDHYWDVNCTDTNGLVGTAADRNINYTAPVVQGASFTNLLTNPGMETGTYTGWTPSITAQVAGACTWNGLVLCIDTGPLYEGNYSVRFSYNPATLSQEIDLVSKGYAANYLDTSPDVNIVDHVIGYFNTSDYYRLKVELRNSSHGVITSYNTGILTSSGSWATINYLFSGYASGLRYIYFERYGDDVESWGGSYGPVFNGAAVYFTE